MAWPSEVPPATRQPVDRGDRRRRGRRSGSWVVSAPWPNATTPMSTVSGCASTKSIAAAWAAAEPGGRDVVGGHAVGHVEGEDHGAGRPRHGDRRLWTGDGRAAGASARRGTAAAAGGGADRPGRGPAAQPGGRAARRSARRCSQRYAGRRGQRRPATATASMHGILEAHAAPALRPADHVDQRRDQVLVGADPVRGHAGPAHRVGHGGSRGRRPRPAAVRGTAGRWCRRAAARRSRRPRPGPARGRAGRAPPGRRRGSRPPRAGG